MIVGIVVAYLTLMLGIGGWVGKTRIAGMTDFLLAGRQLGPFLCAAAMAATHFGGGALLGGAEYGFEHGLSGAWYGISTGIGLCLLGLLTAGRFRRLALYTVPDYLQSRYGGRAVRVLGALLSLLALIGILAAQVNAARAAFGIIGIEGQAAAVLATLVFVAYATLGGLWAATISDAVQIVIAGAGVALAAGVVLYRSSLEGGLQAVVAARGLGDGYLSLFGNGPSFVVWIMLPTVMYTLIGQDFYQRLFAARSASVARRAALAGGLFLIGISFLPAIVGIGARGLSDAPLEAGRAFPWVLETMMGPVVGGIVLAAILAAVMSTADSLLTAATSHVVKDLWLAGAAVEADDERRLLILSRVVTVLVGLCALLVGLRLPGIVDTLIYSYSMYTGGVLVPVLGGVLWRGATRRGALASLLAGSAVALAGVTTGLDVAGVPVEVYSALISAVIFVAVSLATGNPRRG